MDDATREAWLIDCYTAIRAAAMPSLPPPERVLIAYGFGKGGGRGQSASVYTGRDAPAGFLAGIFIHPIKWSAPSAIFAAMTAALVSVAERLGVYVPEEGVAAVELSDDELLNLVGHPPPGLMSDTYKPQRGRQRRYVCRECKQIIYAATDTLSAECASPRHAGGGNRAFFREDNPRRKENGV